MRATGRMAPIAALTRATPATAAAYPIQPLPTGDLIYPSRRRGGQPHRRHVVAAQALDLLAERRPTQRVEERRHAGQVEEVPRHDQVVALLAERYEVEPVGDRRGAHPDANVGQP